MTNSIKQWFKQFVHNSMVHPLLPFLPTNLANYLHDVNGEWAFKQPDDQ